MRGENQVVLLDFFSRNLLFSSVETELFVHFRPHFANTFSVSRNAIKIPYKIEIQNFR